MTPRPERTGRRRAASVRRRRAVAAAAVVGLAGAGVLTFALTRDDPVERMCSRPDDLRTHDGVTLVEDAMAAFAEADAVVGPIDVVYSYRSCRKQAQACRGICGRRSCPGLCAPPGLSWHQRGLAIDITQESLDTPGVVEALEGAGWCQPVPDNDPGHFSFDGCH